MKFWMSGRIGLEIGSDVFRLPLLETEKSINAVVNDKNYGDEIQSFDVIAVIFKEGGEEVFRYGAKEKDTNIEVVVDHDSFRDSGYSGRVLLLIDAVLYAVHKIRGHKKLRAFNFTFFERDLLDIRQSKLEGATDRS
ncbi:MAG: hypothetical protein EOO02_22475 [Chitinophagaceae bacterium]|nr:MAG: hypothetical protein EOO02_22475 [Chitinophagaceae bacterium]